MSDLVNIKLKHMTDSELVAHVRSYAVENYNRHGWDFVVECWTDADILEARGNARTLYGVHNNIRQVVKIQDELRRDIQKS